MKFIFIVQGEGRGHMTQAISLFQILESNGHQVCHVIVGKSKRRKLPAFFEEKITAPITQLESPNFITDRKSKSVKIFKSLIINIVNLPTFLKGVNALDRIVKEENPDKIINFYDFLAGLYYFLKRPKAEHIAIAHQFLLNHSAFEFPKGRIYDRFSLLVGNKLAGFRASNLLCLSFTAMVDEPEERLTVVPPLLRQEVKDLLPQKKAFFLVYMVNHGYSEQVKDFHQKHPDIPLHCFWDKRDEPEELQVGNNLTFHQLNDQKFLQFMSECKGYLTTAGFESVCEAMYFGKPVLMVPVTGHYEQSCNASDATKAGAGISSDHFDLTLLLDYLPSHKDISADFMAWCTKAEDMFLQNLVKE